MDLKWTLGGAFAAVMLLPLGAGSCVAAGVPPLTPSASEGLPVSTADSGLAPHRAVYDLSLHKATAASNVSDIRGRLVLSFTGSQCAGYSMETRIVTQVSDRDGKISTTDLRSSTWEHAQGGQFRFNTAQYLNQRLSEQVTGLAARGGGTNAIDIMLNKPEKRKFTFSGAPMFPTQHSLAVLEAARSGRNVVQANIYDGSEKGIKLYETNTFIGKARAHGVDTGLKDIKNAERLSGLNSWPISISYFENGSLTRAGEGLPVYEFSFVLFANGVSHKLLIDYGGFTIAGNIAQIDFLEPAKCPAPKKPGPPQRKGSPLTKVQR